MMERKAYTAFGETVFGEMGFGKTRFGKLGFGEMGRHHGCTCTCALMSNNLMGTCCCHFHWNLCRQIGRNSAKTMHDNNHEIHCLRQQ